MSEFREFPRIPSVEPRHLVLGLLLCLGMLAIPGCSTLTLHGSALTAPSTVPDAADASAAPQVQEFPLGDLVALSSGIASLTTTPAPRAVALTPRTFAGSPATGPRSSGTVTVSGVTTDLLRVRGGPGTDYLILGKLAPDTLVVAIGRSADAAWLLISDPQHGWISASYVILDHPASALPIRLPANVLPATPTLTAPPTPTGAIAGGPVTGLDFHAEPGALFYAGQCADLFWNVDGVREIYISGQATVGHGRQRVCPKQTTAYQLHVISNNGTAQDAWVSVTTQFNYCPVQVQTQVVIQTPTPGPTQTPWVVVVTATATPTPTATPTATPTRTRTATAAAASKP